MLAAHSCWLLGLNIACHSAASHCCEGLCGFWEGYWRERHLEGGGGWGAGLGEKGGEAAGREGPGEEAALPIES